MYKPKGNLKQVLLVLTGILVVVSTSVHASVPSMQAFVINNTGAGQTYSVSLQILLFMTVLTLLPGLLMAMTAFTRIIIVLSILRQAMGLAQTPTNQILIGITLFLTFFVMSPVFNQVNQKALQPYLDSKITPTEALSRAETPFKLFMLNQTRKNDLQLFEKLAGKEHKKVDEVPLYIVMPAFITSELKTAFQIGFILFLPFLIIDIVVASVLMAMGMMMLSPLIISLPFKIMLFVMVDGWTLVLGSLASSFAM